MTYRDAPPIIALPPEKLLTGGGINGIAPRLRVEPGEHSFFDKTQFRTFREFYATDGTEIAAGATYVIKAVVPVDIILLGLDLILDNGFGRLQTIVGGSDGGVFSETLPIFNQNNMQNEGPSPVPASTVALTAGGTHSGGTVLDILRSRVASATAHAANVEAGQGTQRGVGPDTYHFRLQNIGAGDLEGVLHARWEERV